MNRSDMEYLLIDLGAELAQMDCPGTVWLLGDTALVYSLGEAWMEALRVEGSLGSCEGPDSVEADFAPPAEIAEAVTRVWANRPPEQHWLRMEWLRDASMEHPGYRRASFEPVIELDNLTVFIPSDESLLALSFEAALDDGKAMSAAACLAEKLGIAGEAELLAVVRRELPERRAKPVDGLIAAELMSRARKSAGGPRRMERSGLRRDAAGDRLPVPQEVYDRISHFPLQSSNEDVLDLREREVSEELVAETCRIVEGLYGTSPHPEIASLFTNSAFDLLKGSCWVRNRLSGAMEYDLLDRAGVYLLEGRQLAPILGLLPPTRVGQVATAIALSRAGYLLAGVVDDYADVILGAVPAPNVDPRLGPALGETQGFLAFSDQIGQLARLMCGLTEGEAEKLVKAVEEGGLRSLCRMRSKWIEGASANGYEAEAAESLWLDVVLACGQAISRDLAESSARLALQTAYLKAEYPHEFMTAVLNSEKARGRRLVHYVNSCERSGIAVLCPDVNRSAVEFSRVEEGILFGLGFVRCLRLGDAEGIVSERKLGRFASLPDFVGRMRPYGISLVQVLLLVQAGAFDSFAVPRLEMEEFLSRHYDAALRRSSRGDPDSDWLSLVSGSSDGTGNREHAFSRIVSQEESTLGVFLSGYPSSVSANEPYRPRRRRLRVNRHPSWRSDTFSLVGWVTNVTVVEDEGGRAFKTFEVGNCVRSIGCVISEGAAGYLEVRSGSLVEAHGSFRVTDYGDFVDVKGLAPFEALAR